MKSSKMTWEYIKAYIKSDCDIDKKHPYEMKYVKMVKKSLMSIGAWPDDRRIVKINLAFFCFMQACILSVTTAYAVKNFTRISLEFFVQVIISLLIGYVTAVRTTNLFTKKYKVTSEYFWDNVHLHHFRKKSEVAEKFCKLCHAISSTFTYWVHVTMTMGLLIYLFVPVINNAANGAYTTYRGNMTLEVAIYFSLPVPLDYEHDMKAYLLIFPPTAYCVFYCAISLCCSDLVICIMVFHIWGHLKIILSDLVNMPKPGFKREGRFSESNPALLYDKQEMAIVNKTLKGIIDHHEFIRRFVLMMDNTYGLHLFTFYIFHLLCECCLLLQCSQLRLEEVARFGILAFIFYGQLIQMSMVFELLDLVSQRLPLAVYDLPWEAMDLSTKKDVYIFLVKTQVPISVKALGVTHVGVITMFSVMKTSLSYFTMLKTFSG